VFTQVAQTTKIQFYLTLYLKPLFGETPPNPFYLKPLLCLKISFYLKSLCWNPRVDLFHFVTFSVIKLTLPTGEHWTDS